MNTENLHETLWNCSDCDSWYLCHTTERADTWRLFRLSSVESIHLDIGKAPVWLVCGPDPSVCPQCGMTLKMYRTKAKGKDYYATFQN
ncbi:MAG: hypothetical protein AAF490_24495 [Chloroflexota bacterium]